MPPPAPFIVGVPRSGTTLLRLMLDAHPELAIGPETHFLPDLLARLAAAPHARQALVEAIAGSERWPEFGLSAAELAAAVRGATPFSPAEGVRAFYRLYAARFGKSRWGDKTPGYLLHMEAIQDLLPEARFVHLVRDGRDVALSIRPLWFGPDTLEEAALWWQERIVLARRQAGALRHYLEVRYEDLVTETAAVLRRICDFVELDWSAELLRHAARAQQRLDEIDRGLTAPDGREIAGEARLAMHRHALREPDASQLYRWRTAMSAEELRRFRSLAGATLDSLGYPSGAPDAPA